eukprot:12049569-Prorocentrum_lima.AAC.1
MTSSLVGSEMCIRDRYIGVRPSSHGLHEQNMAATHASHKRAPVGVSLEACLLYTSDAADDM